MSLKYVPPNVPSLITLTGVLFVGKSLYKTPLSSNTELFNLLTASSLLISPKYILNQLPLRSILQCFLTHQESSKHHTFIINICFKFKSNFFKVPIMTKHTFFYALVLLVSIPSETSIFSYCSIFIIHANSRLKRLADKMYHLFQKQI